jgi:hypothetical protein
LLPAAALAGTSLSLGKSGRVSPEGPTSTVSLERLLRDDGPLDPRQSDVGSVEPTGWDMATGPNGAPRLVRHAASRARAFGVASTSDGCSSSIDDSEVLALVTDASGRVYAGGTFTHAVYGPFGRLPSVAGAPGDYIARWNGTTWDSLVTANGLPGPVDALVIDGGGNLYASVLLGLNTQVEKWNGTSWSVLGSPGMNGVVQALAVDAGGNIYAGGHFTSAGGVSVSNVAKWNGSTWSALGTGTNGTVYALAADGAGNVYAGGNFLSAGGVAASGVAKWNGSVWSALGTGVAGSVRELAVDGSGNLFAGGTFLSAGGVSARHIAEWNGTIWSPLGSGNPASTFAMTFDGSGNLIVSEFNYIVQWAGSHWTFLGSPMDNEVLALARGPAGSIVAGGYFTSNASVNMPGVAQWNGSSWSSMGSSISMHVNGAVTALSRDRNGNIYVGGPASADEWEVDGVALLQSGSWSPVGYGPPSSAVYAVAGVSPDSVFVGGNSGVAMWNGSIPAWVNPGPGPCYALALDASGKPYDGGAFAGGNISKWTGSSWTSLGVGVSDTVFALVVDGSGNLYAGGRFASAGGSPASHVAMWNGSAWSPLGGGLGDVVYALAVDGSGRLYAGGAFTGHVALWTGSSWAVLGSGTNDVVRALAVDGAGNVYAGGSFASAGGAPASRIAEWDGASWHALGMGVADNSINALAIDPAGTLYMGGSFTSAGGMIASNSIAQAPVAWLTGFSPTSGTVGSKIEVFGEGLYGATDVKLGGISSSFYVESDTSMTVTVGPLSGPIRVLTACGGSASTPIPFANSGCMTTGLVAWWPAELNANDISGHGHIGIVENDGNGSSFAYPGESGAAFSFDGLEDDVLVPYGGAFDFTGAMSIEGWIKTTAGAGRYIATKFEDSFYLAVGVPGGASPHTLSFWLNGVTPSWVTGVTPIDDGAWHHVAATYDGGNVKLYVDARLDTSVALIGTIQTGTSGILIGSRYSYPVFSATRYAGLIDELAIYNRALNIQEIGGLANPGGPGPCGVGVTGVGEDLHATGSLELAPGWPNPASRVMNFELRLPAPEAVHAEIVDVAGRRVSLPLKEAVMSSGIHRFQWDGRSISGEPVASGVYFLRVRAGSEAVVQRIVLVR